SKKIGCESMIIITKTKQDQSQMIIKYTPYLNHTPGSDNDIETLRLSKQIQNYIAQQMRDGLDVKAISRFFRKQAYNLDKIWNQLIKEDQILHEIEEESLNLWYRKLLNNGDLTCTIAQSESNNNEDKGQLLGFIISITKEIIYKVNTVLFDATHSTNKKNDQLYTFLLPDFKTRKGLPLVHLISSCKNTTSVQFWLYCLHIQLL
ncbi:24386_t:CDS:2, partial [Cetraspora pellucida]